ncbi:MAG: hypothetical protein NTV94_05240, partial [Planctomycetota bacterium]|nr:hypothetical protein [Planctomycetota bacterium]
MTRAPTTSVSQIPASNTRYHAVTLLICTGVLGLAGIGVVALRMRANQEASLLRAAYVQQASQHTMQVRSRVERTLGTIYKGLRTIARLPGVRSIDGSVEQFEGNAKGAVQELYNNIASDVAMSEVYIVPRDLDPDAPTDSKAHKEPYLTFDEMIVGKTADAAATTANAGEAQGPEEVEEFEYRLMKRQLAWFVQHYPNESS